MKIKNLCKLNIKKLYKRNTANDVTGPKTVVQHKTIPKIGDFFFSL